MEMPKPTADHKKLERLAGIWKGKDKLHPSPWDPKGGVAEGFQRGRVSLDGFAVVIDYEQSRDGKKSFAGHGVYTLDPKSKQVVLHWFDTMGQGAEEFRGSWKGEVLTLESKTAMGHARLSYDCSRAGALTSRMEMSQDGKSWAPMLDSTYQRAD